MVEVEVGYIYIYIRQGTSERGKRLKGFFLFVLLWYPMKLMCCLLFISGIGLRLKSLGRRQRVQEMSGHCSLRALLTAHCSALISAFRFCFKYDVPTHRPLPNSQLATCNLQLPSSPYISMHSFLISLFSTFFSLFFPLIFLLYPPFNPTYFVHSSFLLPFLSYGSGGIRYLQVFSYNPYYKLDSVNYFISKM